MPPLNQRVRLTPQSASQNTATLHISLVLRKMQVWEDLALSLLFQWQHPANARRGLEFRQPVCRHIRGRIAAGLLNPSIANTSLAAGLFGSARELSETISSAATQVLSLSLSPSERDAILVTASAGARLTDLMDDSLNLPNDPWTWTFGNPADFDSDEWFKVQSSLAQLQQVGLWLANLTAGLGAGEVNRESYANATTTTELQLKTEDPTLSTNVRLGCTQAHSASFDPTATLNRPQACFYSNSGVGYLFLSMNAAEWAFFCFSTFSDLWLLATFIGAAIFQCKVRSYPLEPPSPAI